jgi:hypothetical protein
MRNLLLDTGAGSAQMALHFDTIIEGVEEVLLVGPFLVWDDVADFRNNSDARPSVPVNGITTFGGVRNVSLHNQGFVAAGTGSNDEIARVPVKRELEGNVWRGNQNRQPSLSGNEARRRVEQST